MMVKLFRKRKSMRFAVIITDDTGPQEAMNFKQGDDPFTLRYSVAGWKIFEPMVNTPIDDPLTDAVNKATRPDRGDRPEVPNRVFFFGVGDPPRTTDHKPIFDQPWMSKVDAVFFLVSGFELPTELCYRNMHSSEGMCSQFDEPTDAPDEMLDDLDNALDGTGRRTEEQSTEGSTEWMEGSAGSTESTHAPGDNSSSDQTMNPGQEKTDETDQELGNQSPENGYREQMDTFPIWLIIVIVVLIVLATLIIAGVVVYFAIVQRRGGNQSQRESIKKKDSKSQLQTVKTKDTKRQQGSKTGSGPTPQTKSMASTYTTMGTYNKNTSMGQSTAGTSINDTMTNNYSTNYTTAGTTNYITGPTTTDMTTTVTTTYTTGPSATKRPHKPHRSPPHYVTTRARTSGKVKGSAGKR